MLLDQLNTEGNPQIHELPVEDARAGLKEMTLAMDAALCDVRERKELMIPGSAGDIPIRIYWPETAESNKSLPILMLYHGGGFVLGDLDTHENMARFYCKHADLIVINVDYSLSPEHKFPLAVEDCYAAFLWAANNAQELGGDANKIAVTGDSAGGNLSAVIAQFGIEKSGAASCISGVVIPSGKYGHGRKL